jgi:hypothetical protein
MLIATPTQGGIHRNPNWVRTKPAPNPNIDARARKIAVVMGVVPRHCLDWQLKIVSHVVPDNAEVTEGDLRKT